MFVTEIKKRYNFEFRNDGLLQMIKIGRKIMRK